MLTLIVAAAMVTTGCMGTGDTDETPENEALDDWGSYYVDTQDELPGCYSWNHGRLYYVVEESGFRACTSSGWLSVDLTGIQGPTGLVGEQGAEGPQGPPGINGTDG